MQSTKSVPKPKLPEVNDVPILLQLSSTDSTHMPADKTNVPGDFLNMKDLVQKTKDNFAISNRNDNRWAMGMSFLLSFEPNTDPMQLPHCKKSFQHR